MKKEQSSSGNEKSPISIDEPQDKILVGITGGCGFLGQHLVKIIQQQITNIGAIRILDFNQFERRLTGNIYYHPAMDSICGSVTSLDDCITLASGAKTVFHLASFTDRHLFTDTHILNTVNVLGTQNVIEACRRCSVDNLVYVSDVAVVMGKELTSIIRGTEADTFYPKDHLFPDGASKCAAEKLVLAANGTPHDFGNRVLRTISLRPVTLYGEADSYLVPELINLGTLNQGHIPCVGNMRSKSHFMYAGNAAWALLCAHAVLSKDPFFRFSPNDIPAGMQTIVRSQSVVQPTQQTPTKVSFWPRPAAGTMDIKPSVQDESLHKPACKQRKQIPSSRKVVGKAFFLCDETPPTNFFEFVKPILWRYGYFITNWTLSEKWAMVLIKIVFVVLWLLYPFKACNFAVSVGLVYYLCHTFTFSCNKADKQLSYTPLYNKHEAIYRTTLYYDQEYKKALTKAVTDKALMTSHVGILRSMQKIKNDVAEIDLGDDGKRFRGKTRTVEEFIARIKN